MPAREFRLGKDLRRADGVNSDSVINVKITPNKNDIGNKIDVMDDLVIHDSISFKAQLEEYQLQ
jgi:hypothetical protein